MLFSGIFLFVLTIILGGRILLVRKLRARAFISNSLLKSLSLVIVWTNIEVQILLHCNIQSWSLSSTTSICKTHSPDTVTNSYCKAPDTRHCSRKVDGDRLQNRQKVSFMQLTFWQEKIVSADVLNKCVTWHFSRWLSLWKRNQAGWREAEMCVNGMGVGCTFGLGDKGGHLWDDKFWSRTWGGWGNWLNE